MWKKYILPISIEVIFKSWSPRQARSLKLYLQVRITHLKIVYFAQKTAYSISECMLPKTRVP